ncbi:MAG TPA: TlpA disulfide reductase family protein [Pyrinomonadaceae bacterium]|nr:TlpA disulfide reductase family protein [Pyrinomonadaceae bacterium]
MKRRQTILRFGIALATIALCNFGLNVGAQKSESSKEKTKLLAIGATAPDWELSDADGKLQALAQYRGKIVVLDFWATWCASCTEVMPQMQTLHEKYKDRGVAVFGVSSWEKNDPGVLMKKKHYTYGLLLRGDDIADRYGVNTLPAVYIIGADGRVVYRHQGVARDFGSIIKKQLGD